MKMINTEKASCADNSHDSSSHNLELSLTYVVLMLMASSAQASLNVDDCPPTVHADKKWQVKGWHDFVGRSLNRARSTSSVKIMDRLNKSPLIGLIYKDKRGNENIESVGIVGQDIGDKNITDWRVENLFESGMPVFVCEYNGGRVLFKQIPKEYKLCTQTMMYKAGQLDRDSQKMACE